MAIILKNTEEVLDEGASNEGGDVVGLYSLSNVEN